MKFIIKHKWILLFFMVLNSSDIFAQVQDTVEWCPSGATWTYSRGAMFSEEYLKLEYEKDTIIMNISVKKLLASIVVYVSDPNDPVNNYSRTERTSHGAEFYYESNDSIYWYHNGGFQFIYSFQANVGDEWIIQSGMEYNCPAPIGVDTFMIDSTSSIVYDGRQFNIAYGSMKDDNWILGSSIINNIGSSSAPYPQPGINCTNTHGSAGALDRLVCYYDDIRGFVKIGSSRDCREMITTVNKIPNSKIVNNQSKWKVYPNPTNGLLQVELIDYTQVSVVGNLHYTLYNISGQEVLQTTNEATFTTLDISHLSDGIYFLTLSDKSNQVLFSYKIIKQ
jgi:hypothetical protein